MKFLNIYDVSKKAGVSTATVSRVLNNSAGVSEKTRLKVMAVIEETGYTPNIFARGLGLNSMSTIGILCADSSDTFLATAIYMVEQGLRKHGYDSLLCCTGYKLEDKQYYLDLLLSKRVDAVILIGSNFIDSNPKNNQYIHKVSQSIPIIIINGYLKGENIYNVLCDDEQTVKSVTDDLIESGANNILYIGRRTSYSGINKRSGFTKAHSERSIPIENWQMKQIDGDLEEVYELLENLSNYKYDAVIAADDELAIAVLKFAKRKGVKVPQELQIVGYNNSKFGRFCDPEISTVDNKLSYSASAAVNTLVSVLDGESAPKKILLSADFIKRETTK